MDPRLLTHYERELHHVRDMGAEFARQFPKIAGRLGLEGLECADPYVERLLEAFAFLAARVQLKIDDEFPRFTQQMLELAYPHYLAPTPSMAIVRFAPNAHEGALDGGFTIPRDAVLRSRVGRRDHTACEYRTSQPVVLWPLELKAAEYTTLLSELSPLRSPESRKARAMLRLTFRTTGGARFEQLALDRLPLFVAGGDEIAMRLYEQLVANSLTCLARSAARPKGVLEPIDGDPGVRPLGFDDAEALLPYGPRSFQGYRLLHEYFAFPSRYMFVELTGLGTAIRKCRGDELELVVLFDRSNATLEGAVAASRFQLFCTPAINLFPRQADRIHVSRGDNEYHLVPDRTRPMDLEVHSVTKIVGHGARVATEREFVPLYRARDEPAQPSAYYTISRSPRAVSARQREQGQRSTYLGSEVFLSLTDSGGGGLADVHQLSVDTLCTNRDLPLHMPLGQGSSDFSLQAGAPIEGVNCVAGPSSPRASHAHGDTAWRLISHLSLNYLSLVDLDRREGARSIRELLSLYAEHAEPAIRKQIGGVRSMQSALVTRPLPGPGPVVFGRGIELTLNCDESHFEGSGAFLLASVLERFFAKYVSINSFTELVLKTPQRGELMRWPPATGRRPTL